MHSLDSLALFLASGEGSIWRWVYRFGGIGLIPFGLLDNSPIPVPGAMDIATILLASHQQKLWLYYALMATAGATLGGFVTYRIARKGGKEAIEKKFPGRKLDKMYKTFERRGFLAVAIPAMLPPPVPLTPFLFVAGALQYPAWKFLTALTAGRIIRYSLLGYLAGHYGSALIVLIGKFGHLGIVGGVMVVAVIAGAAVFFFKKYRPGKRAAHGA